MCSLVKAHLNNILITGCNEITPFMSVKAREVQLEWEKEREGSHKINTESSFTSGCNGDFWLSLFEQHTLYFPETANVHFWLHIYVLFVCGFPAVALLCINALELIYCIVWLIWLRAYCVFTLHTCECSAWVCEGWSGTTNMNEAASKRKTLWKCQVLESMCLLVMGYCILTTKLCTKHPCNRFIYSRVWFQTSVTYFILWTKKDSFC